MFYNAHFVDTEIPALVGGTQSVNLISQSDGGSLTWLFVLPPVLLLAAGAVAGVIGGALGGAVSTGVSSALGE